MFPPELSVVPAVLHVFDMCFIELTSIVGPFADAWPLAFAEAPAPDSVPVTFISWPT
jgi:hypothetical protein